MQYRSEIDGLRAVAVVPVVLFHAGYDIFSGGYVGVDVFFVISGFLITSILIGELEAGTFSIGRFYERRARRILPALFLVMLACVPFAYAWMVPEQLVDFGQSLIAVIFFVSNVLFWREDGYFAAAAELKPLLHTWSLAVEEQYYLIFPVLLAAIWRFGRSKVFWCVIAISVVSFLMSEWGWRNKAMANFYLAPTRAWELLAGSICALLAVGRPQRSSNVLSMIGLAAILFGVFYFDENTPFPSAAALAPVGGTVLIILFATRGTWVARGLSLKPVVGIGLISYSLYLWHQPLFAFARLRSATHPSLLLMTALALVAVLLAWATWRYVERPFRRRDVILFPARGRLFAVSGLAGMGFVAIAAIFIGANGFPNRSNGVMTFAEYEERLVGNSGLDEACKGSRLDDPRCQTSLSPRVLLWGDSYAMHLVQGLVSSDPDLGLVQRTMPSCAPIIGLAPVSGTRTQGWAQDCMRFNEETLQSIARDDGIELVILSSALNVLEARRVLSQSGDLLADIQMDVIARHIRETVAAIHATGARVIYVSPPPTSGWDNGQCLLRSAFFGQDSSGCDFALNQNTLRHDLLRDVSDVVPVYWLDDDICDAQTCHAMQEDVFLYRDAGHLSIEGSRYLGQRYGWMTSLEAQAR